MNFSVYCDFFSLPSKFLNPNALFVSDEIVEDRPFTLPGESSAGKLVLSFSADARFLAVFDQQRPRVLWIWELPYFSLKSVVIHCSTIKCKYFLPCVALILS